jgi:hypothetical protein
MALGMDTYMTFWCGINYMEGKLSKGATFSLFRLVVLCLLISQGKTDVPFSHLSVDSFDAMHWQGCTGYC